jgi:TRAP-type C4-dicarboxylate transport system permease small subunit
MIPDIDQESAKMKISRAVNAFCRYIDRLSCVSGKIACIMLLVLCPLAFYEVVARKAGYPTTWTFHLLGYVQICIIWFGLAEVQKTRGHVTVDLVTRLLPLKLRVITRVVMTFLCAVLSAILLWQGWKLVERSYSIRLMTTEEIHHPVYWIQIPVVIGAGLLFLVFVRQNIADIKLLIYGDGQVDDRP